MKDELINITRVWDKEISELVGIIFVTQWVTIKTIWPAKKTLALSAYNSKTNSVTSDFFYVFYRILSFSIVSQSFKKICVGSFWARTSLSLATANEI